MSLQSFLVTSSDANFCPVQRLGLGVSVRSYSEQWLGFRQYPTNHVRTRVSRAHMRIYILSFLISFPFFFFVDCRVRVSSRVRDSVSFIFFIAFFSFRCMLKYRKLRPGQRCPVGVVVQSSYCAYWVKSHGFESRRACYNFFTCFFPLLLQVFCKSGLALVLALRFVLRLRWALITATKIVVGVVFDGTRK